MSLEGTWYNQIGEIMTLEVDGGSMTGTYQNPFLPGTYPLAGNTDPAPADEVEILSYTIRFINDDYNFHFVTGQSGQLVEVDGEEKIVVQWLVTIEAPYMPPALVGVGLAKEPWTYFTSVGEDVFTRQKPSDDEVAAKLAICPGGHPAKSVSFLQKTSVRLLFGLVKLVLRFFAPKRPPMKVAGTWYNQVGEEMTLEVDGGAVQGTFKNPLIPGTFPLVGQTDPKPYAFAAVKVVSFSVRFIDQERNYHLVMASSGQLVFRDQEEQIVVERLSTVESPDIPLAWTYFTHIGNDVYRRERPSEAEIARNLKACPRALPFAATSLEHRIGRAS